MPPTYYPMAPKKPKRGLWWKIILIVFGAIILAFVGLVILGVVVSSVVSSQPKAEANSSVSAQKKTQAQAQASFDASLDKLATGVAEALEEAASKDRTAMEAEGWTYVADYLYYAEPEGTYQCSSRHTCVQMNVATTKLPNGCPRGISVNISFFTADDVSVYNTVRNTGRLDSGQQAALEFSDLSDQGASYRVDSMKCYG